jgi:hypothetical protein
MAAAPSPICKQSTSVLHVLREWCERACNDTAQTSCRAAQRIQACSATAAVVHIHRDRTGQNRPRPRPKPGDHPPQPICCFGEPRRIDRPSPRHVFPLPLSPSFPSSTLTQRVGYAWAAYQYGTGFPCARCFGTGSSGGRRALSGAGRGRRALDRAPWRAVGPR